MAFGETMTEGAEFDEVALDSDEARLDAILHDPYGYSIRIRKKYDAEAATWVKSEIERRLALERRQRRERAKSFTRWLLRRRGETDNLEVQGDTVAD